MPTKRTKIILEHFQQLLSERGGVSLEVEDEAISLTNIIISAIKNGGWSDEIDRVQRKYLSFDHVMWGNTWHIDCPIFNFLDEESYWINKDKYIFEPFVNFEEKRCLLYIPVINGNGIPQNSLFDTVFHEVAHIFQNIKGACTYGNELYAKARLLYGSSDLTECMIGKVLYYSFDFEQDAIIHGTWGELTKLYGLTYQQAFPSTIGYIAYNEFEKAIDYLKTHKEQIKTVLKQRLSERDLYTYDWLVKRGRNAMKRFEKKLVLVLEKFVHATAENKGRFVEPQKPTNENRKTQII